MTLKRILRAVVLGGGLAGGIAAAGDPQPVKPAIPKAIESEGIVPVVAKVVTADPPANGTELFPKVIAEAKAAHAKARDYVGHIVRQERVNGTLQPEQTGEIRARAEPFSIAVKIMAPKPAAGWETVYVAGKRDDKVRFKPAGVEGLKGFTTQAKDSAKATADTRHPITEVGMLAVLNRAEKIVDVEKKTKNPVQILVSEYTFDKRACLRFEIFADRVHPTRYCHRAVLYVDKATKLPVRFEAYDQPKAGETEGELMEMVSFVNVKTNTGLGDAAFDK